MLYNLTYWQYHKITYKEINKWGTSSAHNSVLHFIILVMLGGMYKLKVFVDGTYTFLSCFSSERSYLFKEMAKLLPL